jgi:hypothetical protein
LIQDEKAPFLNRTSLGLYPPGASLIPFLLTKVYEDQATIDLPAEDLPQDCAIEQAYGLEISTASAGCLSFARKLGEQMDPNDLLYLFRRLGFYEAPQTYLPALNSPDPGVVEESGDAAIGITPPLQLSPLQMAVAAGSLSAAGTKPAPRILLSVEGTNGGWVTQPPLQGPLPIYNPTAVERTLQALKNNNLPIWQSVAVADAAGTPAVTWLVSGTLPSWRGNPMVIVILLEAKNPQAAIQIGTGLWESTLEP